LRDIISQKDLFVCKLAEGSSVSPHVIKMMSYLDKLDFELKDDPTTNVILRSLLGNYQSLFINFHMNDLLYELLLQVSML
jgi:hypothetical protein